MTVSATIERREQRNEVGEPQRLQQTPFDAGQEEQRQEDEHHDDRGEDDRAPDLLAGEVDHLEDGPPLGLGPVAFSRSRRKMFSTSMIASSTSAPMAIASPPSVMLLMDRPASRRPRTAATSDSGMAMSVMPAARMLARNTHRHEDHQERAVSQGVRSGSTAPSR